MTASLSIGVDVGGTFTDIVALDAQSGRLWHHKQKSTPEAPYLAILEGTAALLARLDDAPRRVAFFGHGTTVVTNMILERKGARLALVTTEGFRDVLDLARQARPHVYDYRIARPPALAARRDRFELRERIGAAGEIVTPIDEGDLGRLADALAAGGYEAVAVCFLHSYRNPAHEKTVEAALQKRLPGRFVTCSHAVAPEYREFERFATTALNGFVGPRTDRYFKALAEGLQSLGLSMPLYTVTSNAGLVDVETARAAPVRTALSGPAAGVAGIGRILSGHGLGDLVTFDVGGTSTDIAILPGGRPGLARTREVAGYPVLAPMTDIEVIGAGGGSIARLDAGGALVVGPESAGADPGPAAYGRGATEATVTDAAVVLGRIGAGKGQIGGLALDAAAAARAVRRAVGTPLGLSDAEAAQGIIDIAVAGMARTIRSAALTRGLEPERLCLVAYGGAGPLLGAEVAMALGLRRMVVPAAPGTLCARAILAGDIARDFSTTRLLPLEANAATEVSDIFAAMRRDGARWLAGEQIAAPDQRFECRIECRYIGQSFEIATGFDPAADTPDSLRRAFDAEHARTQGFDLPDRGVEAVTFRLTARAAPATGSHGTRLAAAIDEAPAPRARREVWFGGTAHATPVHHRETLPPRATLAGPAIIEEPTATTALPPGWTCRVLGDGTLDLAPQGALSQ